MNDTFKNTISYDETVPVLIVGGGLIGLSTSLFLSWHGISSLLIERHPGTAIHPRAVGFTPRTMELFRSVGVEEAIRQAEPPITLMKMASPPPSASAPAGTRVQCVSSFW